MICEEVSSRSSRGLSTMKPRPVLLNTWEGFYFDHDLDRLKTLADAAAAIGVERFVLDDGWFANKYPRSNDRAGLGDWQETKSKLPNGLGYLVKEADKRGVKFGIWIEPEMVNPRSALFRDHPDWAIAPMPRR